MSLAVRDLGLDVIAALLAILVIQFLKVGDLKAKTPNLFSKHG